MKHVMMPKFFEEPESSKWTKAVWDRDLARQIDELSSQKFHVSPLALMETAGRAVAELAAEREIGRAHV